MEFNEKELIEIEKEFQRLGDQTYLDHAGTTLYSEKQIDDASKTLKETLFCNPHTCTVTGDLIDQVRFRILSHFNTDVTEYAVVFTANATAALKLVAETFDFGDNGSFYYCQENHTSVLGMREIVNTTKLFMLSRNDILENLKEMPPVSSEENTYKYNGNSLVAFSAQCNFSGYKMPLDVIPKIHENGLLTHGKQIRGDEAVQQTENANEFFICLDTASFAATNFLDLSNRKPDFCCISFYKMFGFPTGVGALLVSKRGQAVLNKKYYGGGTVQIAMTRQDFHKKRVGFIERFEDGTLPFLSIVAILDGFRTLERLVPATVKDRPIQRIQKYVFQLAKYCHDVLAGYVHKKTEMPLVEFYNHTKFENKSEQGGVVTFNLMHDDGSYVGFAEVACLAAVHNIQLRTGCFCNPGACQWFLHLSDDDIKNQFEAGHICSDYNDLVNGVPTGAVRLSFGYMTRMKDVEKVLKLIKDCYLCPKVYRFNLIKENVLPKALKNIANRWKPQLKKVFIYPIKSCGAYEITGKTWELSSIGLQYDRNWMIVDVNGMAVTQKHHSKLCLIKPIVNLSLKMLELQYPEKQSIHIPLNTTDQLEKRTVVKMCQTKVCDDLIEGIDCGDDVSEWLSDCLNIPNLRLIMQNTDFRHDKSGQRKDISLANQAQFLLINRTSVRWLASKIGEDIEPLDTTVDRFRANFVVETTYAFVENKFEKISIGDINFIADGFCKRCQMVCIDQHTGEKTSEPLRTIAREFRGKIHFGIYLAPEEQNNKSRTINFEDTFTTESCM